MDDIHLWAACDVPEWVDTARTDYPFEACTEAATSFKENMAAANGLLIIPGYAFMSGEQWMSCARAASQHFFGNRLPTDQEFSEKREEMTAIASAARQHALDAQTRESVNLSFDSAVYNIEVFAKQFPPMHNWLRGVVKSSIIESWTAFEVLAEDLHTYARQKHPECFSKEALQAKYRFRTERTLPVAYATAFEKTAAIDNSVWNPEVKTHALVRHLLVHRRGIVDDGLITQRQLTPATPELFQYKEGDEIVVVGQMARLLIDRTTESAYKLILAVSEWLAARKP